MNGTSGIDSSSILLVKNGADIDHVVIDWLKGEGFHIEVAKTPKASLKKIEHKNYGTVLLHLDHLDQEGVSVLKAFNQIDPQLPIVILTRHFPPEHRSELLQCGVFDLLHHPYEGHKLKVILQRALEVKRTLRRVADYTAKGLMTSEERYRTIVQAALDAIILSDEEGNILSWNQAARNMFGYTAEEIVGRPLTVLMPPQYRQPHQRGLERVKATGETRVVGKTVALHGLRKNGQEFPVELSLSRSVLPEAMFYCGIIRDITARTNAEQALQESEHRFQLTIDHIHDAVFYGDLSGVVLWANKQAATLLNRPLHEIIGHPLMECLSPQAASLAESRLALVRQGKAVAPRTEFEVIRSDGSLRWVEANVTSVIQNDVVVGRLLVGRDVTERKQQERLLQAIHQAESEFLANANPRETFDHMLNILLDLTRSEYGFIGEITKTPEGKPYLKTHAITNIAWTPELQKMYERQAPNLEFFNLDTLFGTVMTTGQPVIANEPAKDPRRGGFPEGHPPLHAFVGLPFYSGKELLGMVGIANRPEGYDDTLVQFLEPFLTSCGTLMEAYRNNQQRQRAELALVERTRMRALAVEIGQVINKSQDLPTLLQGCTETLVEHLDAAFARIWTLDSKEQVLKLQASAGLYTHLNGPHSRVPVGHLKIGQIAAEKKPLMTNGVIGDPRVPDQEWAKREGMVAFAGYPLLSNQEVVGVLALFSKHPLTDFTLKSLGMVADRITTAIERQMATDAHKMLARLNERILVSAGEGIYGFDLEGNTTFVNPAGAKMLGYEAEELIGLPMHRTIHHTKPDGSPYPGRECPIYAPIRDGIVHHVDNEVLWRKDGTSFPVEYTSTPIRDENNQLASAVLSFRDITEQKKLQDQLIQSERLSSLGVLISGMVHEVRSPMQAIWGMTDLILEEEQPETIKELARDIKRISGHITSVLSDFIIYARPSTSEQAIELNINERLLEALKMVQRGPYFGTVKVDQQFNLVPPIVVRQGELDQVFINLITNAVQAMNGKGHLTLATSQKDGLVVAQISDTGGGIPKDALSKIFDPFFSTKEKGRGTGLGLSIVQQIVRRYGGQLTVESTEGNGTIFTIQFPIQAQSS